MKQKHEPVTTAILPACCLGLLLAALGAILPAAAQSQNPVREDTVAIVGGRLVTITDGIINDGVLLIQGGTIVAAGRDVAVPSDTRRIDASGLTVMPGLFDGFTSVGAADIPALGNDDDEATAPIMPHLRITDSLNPDNRFLPLACSAGITAALCAPADGNLVTGQSAVIRLAGDTVEEMVLRSPAGVHVCLGEPPKLRYGAQKQSPMTRMGSAAAIRQLLIEAREHAAKIDRYRASLGASEETDDSGEGKEPIPPARDLKLEALLPVLRGELPLVVSANRFDDLHTALRIATEMKVKLIINHGAESHRLADRLAAAQIPVIVGPTGGFPSHLESHQAVPDLAARLHRAGVRIIFQSGGYATPGGLLAQARQAVAHGLPAAAAARALTLTPAEVFGVDDRLGSLEAGKSADLVLFDGDPLQGPARATMVFIRGRQTAAF